MFCRRKQHLSPRSQGKSSHGVSVTDYIELLAKVIEQKALGNDEKAKELVGEFKREAGKLEFQWERYYDHFLAGKNVDAIVNTVGKQLE